MRVTEKLKSYRPKSLAQTIIFFVFIVLLVSVGLFLFFNFTKLREDVIEWNLENMHTLVLAYSGILEGDSIELDFQRKRTNAYYDKWSDLSDSLLKKTGVKYLYVMNASYDDSIQFYLSARSHNGKTNFLEKLPIGDFDVDLIKKLKDKSETHICKMGYYPEYGGWLAYTYISVKNSKGEVVAFVGADKDMSDINDNVKKIETKLLLTSFLFFIVVFFLMAYLIRKILIAPIANIIDAANDFHLLGVSFKNLAPTRLKEYDALIESFRNMESKINSAITKSYTDELTKLNNRYFFTLSLENILEPVREEKKIAFFIIDIDSFKQINDNYGHEKGDFVLRNTGIILKQVFGDLPGVVVRLGGDEFAVCLDNIGSRQIVEDKCKSLKEELSQITYAEGKTGVSVSIGIIITKFSKTPPIYTEIFSAADNNLYKVKAKGKNDYLISEI
ncbi:MAG: GGDEF domain-containing protein [Fibromonadaceae bacterium]|jgi:diguanylate cyclase (GGDEF)-like protein|nr:GGDEF domain-containing protein [Fibromonadaceae bacterium]